MSQKLMREKLALEIKIAQDGFKELMTKINSTANGLQTHQYVAYLSMQYHLTKDVQAYFYAIAGNHALEHKKSLRKFLVDFANEEEPHYEIAETDIRRTGAEILPINIWCELWHAYFRSVVTTRPFLRLGAACVLENISSTSTNLIDDILRKSKCVTNRNSTFITLHRHGEMLPHGDIIMKVIEETDLSEEQIGDMVHGAEVARTLYMAMAMDALGM